MLPADVAVSRHARERWAERFPDEEMEPAMGRAVLLPTPRLEAWAKATKYPKLSLMGLRGWHDPAAQAMFLVRHEHGYQPTVVTVIPFKKPRRGRRKRLPGARPRPREPVTADVLDD